MPSLLTSFGAACSRAWHNVSPRHRRNFSQQFWPTCGIAMVMAVITLLVRPGGDYFDSELGSLVQVDFDLPATPLRMPVNKTFSFIMHSHTDPGWLVTMEEYEALAVTNILNSTTAYLSKSPTAKKTDHDFHKFTYDAVAFLRSWIQKHPANAALLKSLSDSNRLNIINGGISMHDQACCYLDDIIANYEYGREYTKNVLGSVPLLAWSIDPFGASRGSARIFAEMGFDALGLNRLPIDIKRQKRQDKDLIFWWKNSNSSDTTLLTFATAGHYATPVPFDFHQRFPTHFGREPPNTDMLSNDFNLMAYMAWFSSSLVHLGTAYQEQNIMLLVGDDFSFADLSWDLGYFDQILSALACNNVTGPFTGLNLQVKTLVEHLQAVRQENKVYRGDELPNSFPLTNPVRGYAEAVWAGFFTSKPFLKGMIKAAGELHRAVVSTFTAYALSERAAEQHLQRLYPQLEEVRFNLGILQHHDGITGTNNKHVSDDYVHRVEQVAAQLHSLFSELAGRVSGVQTFGFALNQTAQLAADQSASAFTVFNYHPFGQRRVVTARYPKSLSGRVRLVDLDAANATVSTAESCDDSGECELSSAHRIVVVGLSHRSFGLLRVDPPAVAASKRVQLDQESPQFRFRLGDTSCTVRDGGPDEPGLFLTVDRPGREPTQLHVVLAAYDVHSMYDHVHLSGHYTMLTFGDPAPVKYSHIAAEVDAEGAFATLTMSFVKEAQWLALPPWSPIRLSGQVTVRLSDDLLQELDSGRLSIPVTTRLHPIVRDEVEVVLRFRVVGFQNEGKFSVDSNGLENLEHHLIKDKRIEYSYQPVSRFIQIKDPVRNLKLTVLNDRAQGGTSPAEGVVELNIARANDGRDIKGMVEPLREPQLVVLKHTLVLEDAETLTFRAQQVQADTPWLYMHHKPGQVKGLKLPPRQTNDSSEYPYLRVQLEFKPDGYLLRLFNMHDTEATTVPCLFSFVASLYSLERPFSLEPRSLDYTMTRQDVLDHNYIWRNKTSVLANMPEVQKGKPWTIPALSIRTYRLSLD